MTRTFLATLQFDGTRFLGWQRQSQGRTVQAEVERVLERLCGRRVVAHAAGRTDAGVHALGLGVSCSVPASWKAADLHRALNALLPADCWVADLQPMRAGFHARKSASLRRYRYDIGTDAASRSPFRRRYEWALGRDLDLDPMQQAAAQLLGQHDFRAFAVKGEPKPHYRSNLTQSRWLPRPDSVGLSYHVAADRFLHHMVRMLVGTMVDIGLGRRPLADLERLLEQGDNQETSPPAPPEGLYFVQVEYPPECYLSLAEVA